MITDEMINATIHMRGGKYLTSKQWHKIYNDLKNNYHLVKHDNSNGIVYEWVKNKSDHQKIYIEKKKREENEQKIN
tara:strand:+ start:392 stop:619 length:228 start_codon:yes stop_codon:yes gene_type:complete